MNRVSQLNLIGVLFTVSVILSLPQEVLALSALEEWNAAARDALPTPVKIWLGLMLLSNLAALVFVRKHVAARWVFVGFLVSHFLVLIGFWVTETPILAGQVSLFHIIFWTPGIYMLWRTRKDIKWVSPYAVWAIIMCVFYAGSMLVDIKDAFIFLWHFFGG
jgi:hypothetical protein